MDPLTSNVRPATDALVTIRVIKSFPYRNVKNFVTTVNLKETSPQKLLEDVHKHIASTGAFRPFRNVTYDTVKIYTQAHGTKSMNLVINFDNDEDWVLESPVQHKEQSLWDLGVRNETELSVFKWDDYEEYKKNPEEKW